MRDPVQHRRGGVAGDQVLDRERAARRAAHRRPAARRVAAGRRRLPSLVLAAVRLAQVGGGDGRVGLDLARRVPTAMTLPKSSTKICWQTDIIRSIRCSMTTTLVCAARLGDQLAEAGQLGLVQAAGRLVEQQQPRLARPGPGPSRPACAARGPAPTASRRPGRRRPAGPAPAMRPVAQPPLVAVRPGQRRACADQKPARRWLAAPIMTFSSTVRPANRPVPWSVRAMPSPASLCGRSRASGRPPKLIVPACGRTKPHRTFSSVVLPAPFGPMIPVTWRPAAVSETSSSAVRPPNRTVTPRTSRTPLGRCQAAAAAPKPGMNRYSSAYCLADMGPTGGTEPRFTATQAAAQAMSVDFRSQTETRAPPARLRRQRAAPGAARPRAAASSVSVSPSGASTVSRGMLVAAGRALVDDHHRQAEPGRLPHEPVARTSPSARSRAPPGRPPGRPAP